MDHGLGDQQCLVRRRKQRPGRRQLLLRPVVPELQLRGGLGRGHRADHHRQLGSRSGNRWTIPWGLQISKVSHVGSRPINVLIGYYRNSEHPEGGADSQVRFQISFLFPQASR